MSSQKIYDHKFPYLQSSTKSGENIDQAFNILIEKID